MEENIIEAQYGEETPEMQNAVIVQAAETDQSKGGNLVHVAGAEELPDDPEALVTKIFQMITEAKRSQSVKNEAELFETAYFVAQTLMGMCVPYKKAREIILAANAACGTRLNIPELNKTVKSAFGYETDTIDKLMTFMNKLHAVVNVGGKCRVMNIGTDPDTGLRDFTFSSPADFKAFYSNRKIESEEGRELTLGALWFSSLWRKDYLGITFNPMETPEGYFNLWTGFAVEPKKGDCSKFLEHVQENIANGNQAIYDYLVAWMADVVQNPSTLAGVTPVLRGAMGTGKGVFAKYFGSLFGRHYMPIAQASQLTGRFNDHMKDKVLLFADEAFWAGDKQAEGVLKALITEDYIVIEGKGENAFKIKNHLHFIFATNNSWCVPAGPQERRFFVLDVGEKRMKDSVYFGKVIKEMETGGREALLHFLMNYDLSGIDLRDYPQTSALMEQKLHSMPPVEQFWYSRLESGILINGSTKWDVEAPVKSLYRDFVSFCIDVGVRHKPCDSEFGIQLRKIVPKLSNAKGSKSKYGEHRPNVYRVPELAECREKFCELMNYKIEWPVYADSPSTEPATETTEQE